MSIACFSLCRLEEIKLLSLIFRAQAWHTRSDVMSHLSICGSISDFWNSLRLESIRGLEKGFCMGIFKFSEWDLEQTTRKSTIIVYTCLDSFFAAIYHVYRANTTSGSFVLTSFYSWLAVLIRFTKPVIGLSKHVTGVAIKYTGHPGRLFLAASPLVFAALPLFVFAFKLLKPPSYAG